jgi:hypothetical protein
MDRTPLGAEAQYPAIIGHDVGEPISVSRHDCKHRQLRFLNDYYAEFSAQIDYRADVLLGC